VIPYDYRRVHHPETGQAARELSMTADCADVRPLLVLEERLKEHQAESFLDPAVDITGGFLLGPRTITMW
jgi:hypothetical protein